MTDTADRGSDNTAPMTRAEKRALLETLAPVAPQLIRLSKDQAFEHHSVTAWLGNLLEDWCDLMEKHLDPR